MGRRDLTWRSGEEENEANVVDVIGVEDGTECSEVRESVGLVMDRNGSATGMRMRIRIRMRESQKVAEISSLGKHSQVLKGETINIPFRIVTGVDSLTFDRDRAFVLIKPTNSMADGFNDCGCGCGVDGCI